MDDTIRMTGTLDPRARWEATHCSVAKAFDAVSTRSALLILREAFYGTARFDDFVQRVGITDAVAAARLRELVAEGLLEREPYREPGQRTRHGYRLTEKGADFLPALVALMGWGDRWLNEGGRVELVHRECGGRVAAEVRCERGHQVAPGELDLALRARRFSARERAAPAR